MQARQGGYTYLLVLFLVAGIGAITAGVGQTWQARAQREKEAELIAIGVEFARALRRYHDASPEAAQTWPGSLEVLVEDRRFPEPQRHLRRIYPDPLTGKAEWGIERNDTGITGVYSLSDKTPFKRYDLPPALGEAAASAESYRQWVFRPVDETTTPAIAPYGGATPFSGLSETPNADGRWLRLMSNVAGHTRAHVAHARGTQRPDDRCRCVTYRSLRPIPPIRRGPESGTSSHA